MNFSKYKKMVPFLCIIAGSLITIVAGFVDYRNKLQEKQEQLDSEIKRSQEIQTLLSKSQDIIAKSNTIIGSQQTVIDTSKKIIGLQNELNVKNNQIQKLQNTTYDNITGGSNIPHAQFMVVSRFGLSGWVANKNKELPVRNVSMEVNASIMDFFKDTGKGYSKSNNPNAIKHYKFQIGDLSKNSQQDVFGEGDKSIYNEVMYGYSVRWLNGFYTGSIVVKLNNAGDYEVTQNQIDSYSEGLDLKGVVLVNGKNETTIIPLNKNQGKPVKTQVIDLKD
jgi:hypothetical protein